VNTNVLMLALNECDSVAAEKHLHLGVAVLEKLILSDFALVPEKVDLKASGG